MDHYADDLATVIDTLGLREVAVIGFLDRRGRGRALCGPARYVTRIETIGLISAVPPLMVKTPGNPDRCTY